MGSLENPRKPGKEQLVGNASVTVAYNVFVNVWRRSPRIATSNFGHIYNNFLYQWGFGNDEDKEGNKTNTWRGMEVGGGEGVAGGGINGTALIQANRFIPWRQKQDIVPAIKIHPNTLVDLGAAPQGSPATDARLNEFDKPSGRPSPTEFPSGTTLTDTFGIDRTAQTVPNAAGWQAIINQSGPRGGRSANKADGVARQAALDALPST